MTMLRRGLGSIGFFTVFSTITSVQADPRVDVCHVPPGHPENAHVISLKGQALTAHLAHGDEVAPDGNPNYHCSNGQDTVETLDHDFSAKVIRSVAALVATALSL